MSSEAWNNKVSNNNNNKTFFSVIKITKQLVNY